MDHKNLEQEDRVRMSYVLKFCLPKVFFTLLANTWESDLTDYCRRITCTYDSTVPLNMLTSLRTYSLQLIY